MKHAFPGMAAIVLLGACLLTGCGDKSPGGQVAAIVNSDEITIGQVNHLIKRNGGRVQADAALEQLIDRQLALQAALSKGLDRQAEIQLRLEEARRDILAAAYIESLSLKSPKVQALDIGKFYEAHPGLFAKRRTYRLRVLNVVGDQNLIDETNTMLARGNSLDDVENWLKQRQVKYAEQTLNATSEQLPIEAADRLSNAANGQTIGIKTPQGLMVFQVKSSEAAPLSLAEATPGIRAHLVQQTGGTEIKGEMDKLRSNAKVKKSMPPDQPTAKP